jgi:short-subunit dehydrogenase involved in D-alanine esterification of teichoic acids
MEHSTTVLITGCSTAIGLGERLLATRFRRPGA